MDVLDTVPPVYAFAILTLASFRLTRVIALDDWPPTKWFREWVFRRTGKDSAWTDFISCPWCVGTYITTAVFAEHYLLDLIPMMVYVVLASMALVGYLGVYSER